MKKILIVIVILAILLVGSIILDTYSKYSSSGTLNVIGNTGAWDIEINGDDITNTTRHNTRFYNSIFKL